MVFRAGLTVMSSSVCCVHSHKAFDFMYNGNLFLYRDVLAGFLADFLHGRAVTVPDHLAFLFLLLLTNLKSDTCHTSGKDKLKIKSVSKDLQCLFTIGKTFSLKSGKV